MHVIVPTKSLSAALRTVKPALGRGPLAFTRLEADGEDLSVTATDVDLTITTRLAAEVRTAGVALAAHDLLRKAATGAGSMLLTLDEHQVVASGKVVTRVPGADPDTYPLTARPEAERVFSIDVDHLRSVVRAASTDMTRPILTGVLFTDQGELVATDSYRLHVVDNAHPIGATMLVPARAIAAIVAHVKEGALTVYQSRDHALFVAQDHTSWGVRLLDPDFPNWRGLLPTWTEEPYKVWFPRPAFEETLRSMDKTLGQNDGRVHVHEGTDNLVVTLHADRGEGALVEATLPGSSALTFGVNPAFLADAVAGLSTCTIHLVDPLKPLWLRENLNGSTHLRLLMPVKIKGGA